MRASVSTPIPRQSWQIIATQGKRKESVRDIHNISDEYMLTTTSIYYHRRQSHLIEAEGF